MRIITCASYHFSGSSALTDLISEFDGVKSFGDWEFSFVHNTDGIADLEYHLVENFNRHNSARAIRRYLKFAKLENGNIFNKHYRGFFGDAWLKYSYDYISQLSDVTYEGIQFDRLCDMNWLYWSEKILLKLLRGTIWRNDPKRGFAIRKEKVYCAHPSEEKFLYCTRKYINDLFEIVKGDNEFIMADQIVSSANIERYLRYFDDIKVVVVDRDPRDIYIYGKTRYCDGVIPTNVEEFCKWFTCIRENGKYRHGGINDEQIKFLWLENLIYKYDKTVKELTEWLGLDPSKHVRTRQAFNPDVSIKNTRLWEKENCNMNEIHYIEEHLKDYLYLLV